MTKRSIIIALVLTGLMIVPLVFVGCGESEGVTGSCNKCIYGCCTKTDGGKLCSYKSECLKRGGTWEATQ